MPFADVFVYVRGVVSEVRRVRWVGYNEVLSSSIVVLVLTLLVMAVVLCVDWSFVYFVTILLGVR